MGSTREGPIAVLAGSGQLSVLVRTALERSGRAHRILAIRGFAPPAVRVGAEAVLDLLDVRGILGCLKTWNPAAVVLAGGVQRPTPAAVLGAYAAVRNRRELSALMSRGDDGLLRGVVSLLEENGHLVIGAHDIAPELLAAGGVHGRHGPDGDDERTISLGLGLLERLSPYDIGQGVVVAGQRVLGVEGPEGTDRMLRRVARLGRGRAFTWGLPQAGGGGGVLVKMPKRGQDLRVDMPAVGPRTFIEAARAGLRGVAVGAGSTLIIEREAAIAAADRLGLFLVGVEAGESRDGGSTV